MTKLAFDLMQGTENSVSREKREPNGHKYRQKELLGDTSTTASPEVFWHEYEKVPSIKQFGDEFKKYKTKTSTKQLEDIGNYEDEKEVASSIAEVFADFERPGQDLEPLQQSFQFPSVIHEKAQRISRVHFLRSILDDLDQIREYIGNPLAAVYVKSLLNTILTMRDLLTFDPFLEIMMALHDALAYENKWYEYGSEQYEKVHKILKKIGKIKSISNEIVEKSIWELEDIGFDTTPFECSFEEQE